MARHIAGAIAPFVQEIPFAKVVPAIAATALYLNAKYDIVHDLTLSKNFFQTAITCRLRESRDRLNPFYRLEEWVVLTPFQSGPTGPGSNRLLVFEGRSWTYREGYDLVLKYASWLHFEMAVRPGDVVAIDMTNSDTFIWIWYALWSLGAKPAFINYNLTSNPLIHSVKSSDARLIVVEDAVYDRAFSDDVRVAFSDPHFCPGGPASKIGQEEVKAGEKVRTAQPSGPLTVAVFDHALKARIEGQMEPYRAPDRARAGQKLPDMAALIYTSGTTGLPKPAIVSWSKANVTASFASMWTGLTRTDVMYTCMPLYHAAASIVAFGSCLRVGAALSLGKSFHRSQFWQDVRDSDATVINYVGETCRYLLSAPPSPLDRAHKVRLAVGNGLRPDIWDTFKARFGIPSIAEFYGATEGPAGTWNLSNNSASSGAVGRIGLLGSWIFGSMAAIAAFDYDANTIVRDPKTGFGRRVRKGEPGELLYRLDRNNISARFQGYYKNEGASSKKILLDVFEKGDAWFSTGDLLRQTGDGFTYFCDRTGDTFRWKSENVSTFEVADVMGKHAGVEEANVYGVEVPNHDGRAGCAAVVVKPGVAVESVLRTLPGHLRASLPRYAVPIFLRVTDTLDGSRTGTNKQQKHGFRDEGIDVVKVRAAKGDAGAGGGDRLFWLPPGKGEYVEFGEAELAQLRGGEARL